MAKRTVFKTLQEAEDYLWSEVIDADILALPPEVDELTDEEKIDDDDLSLPVVNDVPGSVEINVDEFIDEEEFDEEDDLPLSSFVSSRPSTSSHISETPTKRVRRDKGDVRPSKWVKMLPTYDPLPSDNICDENLESMKNALQNHTPVQIFEELFTNEIYKFIVEETMRYAYQKNKHGFSVDVDDIKIFFGFLIFTGYHTLPSERDYWSDHEDLGVQIVKNAMSRNIYYAIKSCLHFQDNSKFEENKHDKGFKIRPLIQVGHI